MSEVVVILGAGASVSAGTPVMRNFLVKANQLKREGVLQHSHVLNEFYRVVEILQRANAKSTLDVNNIEQVWTALEMASIFGRLGNLGQPNDEEHTYLNPLNLEEATENLKRVIVDTIESSMLFPAQGPPQVYREIASMTARRLKEGEADRLCFLTFNYDVGLDYAFLDGGVRFSYGFREPARTTVDLLKLHGSLNWVKVQGGQIESVPMHSFRKLHGSNDHRLCLDENRLARKRKHDPQATDSLPYIVPPGLGKFASYKETRELRSVWQRAAQHMAGASRIIVAGYSFPATDDFFRTFFSVATISSTPLEKFIVIDTDPHVKPRYQELLGVSAHSGFEFHQADFSKTVGGLENLMFR